MNEFILILTLALNGGNDGQGGVAMAEFKSESACVAAGDAWKKRITSGFDGSWLGGINNSGSFYLCVPKGGE